MTSKVQAAGAVARHNGRVDPHSILGLAQDASAREVTAAYRDAAKRWHPDRGGGAAAERRMAEVNVAYDLLRDGGWRGQILAQAAAATDPRRRQRSATRGAWLAPAIRAALGTELIAALEPEEEVRIVTPTSTWASARAVLAVTDRRLLWLLDDAVARRVHSLRFSAVGAVEQQLRRPRRRVAVLRIETTTGRRFAFSELRPATADAIAGQIAAATGRPG
jgi:hypothetical protein